MAQQQQARALSGQIIQATRERSQPVQRAFREDQRLQVALAQAESITEVARSAVDVADAAARVLASAIEAYKIAKAMDVLLEQHRIDAQTSVEKLRIVAPIASRQIEALSVRVDGLLSQAAAINPGACTTDELRHRADLLDLARGQSIALQELMMRLLAI